MRIARPSDLWTEDSVPKPGAIEPGAIVQLMIKLPECLGFNSTWCRITRRTTSGLEAVVLDGPLRGKSLGFGAGNVFSVL